MHRTRYQIAIFESIRQQGLELAEEALPCGGRIFKRQHPAPGEPDVHMVFSPLQSEHIRALAAYVAVIHPQLADILLTSYADLLSELNGCIFYYPRVSLKGFDAPREVNIQDIGYSPWSLITINAYERSSFIPADELLIGGIQVPPRDITIDARGMVRVRAHESGSIVLAEFTNIMDLLDTLIDVNGSNAQAWMRKLAS